mgnify:CR=1 FL=1
MRVAVAVLAAAAMAAAVSRSDFPGPGSGPAAPLNEPASRAMYTRKYESASMRPPTQAQPPRAGAFDIFIVPHTHDDAG